MSNALDWYDQAPCSVRESLRALYSNIQFARIGQDTRAIAVTSTAPQEGKSTLCCFLGISIAEQSKRVLLVETDLHRPQLASYLGRRNRNGLVSFVTNPGIPIEQVVTPTEIAGLFYTDCGTLVPNPSEVINAPRFTEFIHRAKAAYDFVIFDTPPLQPFIDAALIAPKMDGVVVAVRAGRTDYKKVRQVVAQLRKANALVLGAAFNDVDIQETPYGAYGAYGYENRRRTIRERRA